jgi:hypothetical protein
VANGARDGRQRRDAFEQRGTELHHCRVVAGGPRAREKDADVAQQRAREGRRVCFDIEVEWASEVFDHECPQDTSTGRHRVVQLECPAERADGARRFGLEQGRWLGVRSVSVRIVV